MTYLRDLTEMTERTCAGSSLWASIRTMHTMDFRFAKTTKICGRGIRGKRVVICAFLALALPMSAWADRIDLTNRFGSASIMLSSGASASSSFVAKGVANTQPKRVICSGGFSGTTYAGSETWIRWALVPQHGWERDYTFSGDLGGMLYGSRVVTGSRTREIVAQRVTREPGSLWLLGTGLLGAAGLVRRKRRNPGGTLPKPYQFIVAMGEIPAE